MTRWMAIIKTRTTKNFVPMLIHCVFVIENTKKTKKEHEKMKRKKITTNDNLILSHVNLIFLLIGPSNWTLCLYTRSLYLNNNNLKMGST
jgi:hypothetical protein